MQARPPIAPQNSRKFGLSQPGGHRTASNRTSSFAADRAAADREPAGYFWERNPSVRRCAHRVRSGKVG